MAIYVFIFNANVHKYYVSKLSLFASLVKAESASFSGE